MRNCDQNEITLANVSAILHSFDPVMVNMAKPLAYYRQIPGILHQSNLHQVGFAVMSLRDNRITNVDVQSYFTPNHTKVSFSKELGWDLSNFLVLVYQQLWWCQLLKVACVLNYLSALISTVCFLYTDTRTFLSAKSSWRHIVTIISLQSILLDKLHGTWTMHIGMCMYLISCVQTRNVIKLLSSTFFLMCLWPSSLDANFQQTSKRGLSSIYIYRYWRLSNNMEQWICVIS